MGRKGIQVIEGTAQYSHNIHHRSEVIGNI